MYTLHTHSQITLKFNPLQTNKHGKPKRIENEIKIAKLSLYLSAAKQVKTMLSLQTIWRVFANEAAYLIAKSQ